MPGTTQRVRSFSEAVPGNNDAVWPSSPMPSKTSSIAAIVLVLWRSDDGGYPHTRRPQFQASPLLASDGSARDEICNGVNNTLVGHGEVAVWMRWRDATFIAEQKMHFAPIQPSADSGWSKLSKGISGWSLPTGPPETVEVRNRLFTGFQEKVRGVHSEFLGAGKMRIPERATF